MCKFTRIDESLLHEHFALTLDDECYFLRELTPGQGYEGGETNQLIYNFKKDPRYKGTNSWWYKTRDTRRIANEITQAIPFKNLKDDYWILVPPSKIRTDPGYDSRAYDLMGEIEQITKRKINILDIIFQIASTESDHSGDGSRRSIQDLIDNYQIINPPKVNPEVIFIFDDVLTCGRHFKAVQQLISPIYPNASIVGLFIARTIHPSTEFEFNWFE